MKIDANKTRLMQIAAFLIKNHSYQFVSVQQTEHEIWLVNPKNDEYPVIRLTSNESGALYFDKNRVLQVHSAISQVFKRESRLLQLCINDENSIDEDDEILISVVRREQIYGFDVNSVFPGIQKALTPFDNPQIEYALILKELELISRQNAVQKSKLLNGLINKPQYIEIEEWANIIREVDYLFNDYTQRLSKLIPSLTESDIQICCLIKLHINNPTIATLLAISSSSVTKRKVRLKERIVQTIGTLGDTQSLEIWLWEF